MRIKTIPGHEGHIVTEFVLQRSDVTVDPHPVDYGNFDQRFKPHTARAWLTMRLTDTARDVLRKFVHGEDVDWDDTKGSVYHKRFITLNYVHEFPSHAISWKGVKKVNQHKKWKAAVIEANAAMENDDFVEVLEFYRLNLHKTIIDPSNKRQADYYDFLADMDRIDWDSIDNSVVITRAINASKAARAVLDAARETYIEARRDEYGLKRVFTMQDIKSTDNPAVKYYADDIIKKIETDHEKGKLPRHSFGIY